MTKWVWTVEFSNKNFLKKCRFLGCQKTDLKTVLYCQKCLYGVYNVQKPQNFPGAAPPTPAVARSGRYAPLAHARCPNITGSLRSPKLDVTKHTRFAREICINSGDLRNLLFGGKTVLEGKAVNSIRCFLPNQTSIAPAGFGYADATFPIHAVTLFIEFKIISNYEICITIGSPCSGAHERSLAPTRRHQRAPASANGQKREWRQWKCIAHWRQQKFYQASLAYTYSYPIY